MISLGIRHLPMRKRSSKSEKGGVVRGFTLGRQRVSGCAVLGAIVNSETLSQRKDAFIFHGPTNQTSRISLDIYPRVTVVKMTLDADEQQRLSWPRQAVRRSSHTPVSRSRICEVPPSRVLDERTSPPG